MNYFRRRGINAQPGCAYFGTGYVKLRANLSIFRMLACKESAPFKHTADYNIIVLIGSSFIPYAVFDGALDQRTLMFYCS